MPDLNEELRNEDLSRDIDRSPEKEDEKKEEKVKEAVEGVIREAGLKPESRDVILVEHAIRSIEKDPLKPVEVKQMQQGFLSELIKDKGGKSIDDIDRLSKEASIKAYDMYIQGMGREEDRNEAKNVIREIINLDNGVSGMERSGMCQAVIERLDNGYSHTDTWDRGSIMRDGMEISRMYQREPERDTSKESAARDDADRMERTKDITERITKDTDAGTLQQYCIYKSVEGIERNPYHDDSFKEMQERFVESYIKTTTQTNVSPQEIIRASEEDAFRLHISEMSERGLVSSVSAHTVLNDIRDMEPDERSARMEASMIMMEDGSFGRIPVKDLNEQIGKMAAHLDIRKDVDIKMGNERVQKMPNLTEESREELSKSLNTSMFDDRLKEDILNRAEEKFLTEKEIQPERMREMLLDVEKEAVKERITGNQENLSPSQDRAVSYVEKYMDGKSLTDEKQSYAKAILDAYEGGRIPDRQDIPKKTERAITHNIESSARNTREFSAKEGRTCEQLRSERTERVPENYREIEKDSKASLLADAAMWKMEREPVLEYGRDSFKQEVEGYIVEGISGRLQKSINDDKLNEIMRNAYAMAYEKELEGRKSDKALEMINRALSGKELKDEQRVPACEAIRNAFLSGDTRLTKGNIKNNSKFMREMAEEGQRLSAAAEKRNASSDAIVKNSMKNETERDEKPRTDTKEPEKKEPDSKDREDLKENRKLPEKESRPIGTDPDRDAREEAKVSKKTQFESAKEIYEKCAQIYEVKYLSATHHTDTRLSQEERDIVQKTMKLRQESVERNNAEKAKISRENIELQKSGKEVPKENIEKLGRLEKYIRGAEREIDKLKRFTDPAYRLEKEIERPAGESREHMKKDIEEKTIYPDPSNSKLFHFKEEPLSWRDHKDVMMRVTYEAVLYSCLTGRKPSSIAGNDITTFEVRNERLPVSTFNRAFQEARHSDGVRLCLEIFKVDNRKAKPIEINNVCAVIDRINTGSNDDRAKEYQRLVVADMCRMGQIPNSKMDDEKISSLYERIVALGLEKEHAKEPVNEAIDRERGKIGLRESLTSVPERTDKEIAKIIISSKEKLDIQALIEISRDVKSDLREQAPVDKDGNKLPAREMETYNLSRQELRQIVCGPNPEALSSLYAFRIKMPDGVEINREMYDRAVSVIRSTNEKNDVVKMAMVNFSLSKDGSYRGMDGVEAQRMDIIERKAQMLVKSTADPSSKHEAVKFIRQDLRDEISREREDIRQEAKNTITATNYTRPTDEILKNTSRAIGKIVSGEDYDRKQLYDKLDEVRSGMKLQRKLFGGGFESLLTRDRCLGPNDARLVAANDPRMFLNIQRVGIGIGRNGLINESRLKDTINRMEQIPKEHEILRMAILEKNFVKHKNNSMHMENAINMGDRDTTRRVNNLAIWAYAREHSLPYREPANEAERKAFIKDRDLLISFEKKAAAEKDFIVEISSKIQGKELMDVNTFKDLKESMLPIACIASERGYEDRLSQIAESLKREPDASSERVQESIKILETLSKMTSERTADTSKSEDFLNMSYDRNGKMVDIDVSGRFTAIRAVEISINGSSAKSYMDELDMRQQSIKGTALQSEQLKTKIDQAAHGVSGYIMQEDRLMQEAVGRYLEQKDFNTPLSSSIHEEDASGKLGFLIDTGYSSRVPAVKDGDRVIAFGKQDEAIDRMYAEAMRKTEGIRDNMTVDGRPDSDFLKKHINTLGDIERESTKFLAERSLMVGDETLTREQVSKLSVSVESRKDAPFAEESLKGLGMYKSVDEMNYLSLMGFYESRMDKIKPAFDMAPFHINASDLKTIMENRVALVDSGIHYRIEYANDSGRPTFQAYGLNDVNVSNIPQNLYDAITRSCSSEDAKMMADRRHEEDEYRMAGNVAVLYQKYNAEFNRAEVNSSEYFNVKEEAAYSCIEQLYNTRNDIFSSSLSLVEKASIAAILESSRQNLFSVVPKDILNHAVERFEYAYQIPCVSPEHSAYLKTLDVDEPREYIESPWDVAIDLNHRFGVSPMDGIGFERLYEEGKITDYELKYALMNIELMTPPDAPFGYVPDFIRDPIVEPPEDYYERDIYKEEENPTVYSDSDGEFRNAPFANLFGNMGDMQVYGEDELDSRAPYDIYDSGAAYYEDGYDENFNSVNGEYNEGDSGYDDIDIELSEEASRLYALQSEGKFNINDL